MDKKSIAQLKKTFFTSMGKCIILYERFRLSKVKIKHSKMRDDCWLTHWVILRFPMGRQTLKAHMIRFWCLIGSCWQATTYCLWANIKMVSNRGISLAFYEVSHEERVRIMHNIITVLYTSILHCNKRTDGRTSDSEFIAEWSLWGDAFSNEMLD